MAIDINFGALQHANPFAAYTAGQEIGQQNRQRQARQAAGNIFASDPDQAAQILMGAGDYEAGLTLRKYAQQDRQEKARTSALGLAAKGDIKGGKAEALNAGDVDTYNALAAMDEEQRKTARQNAEDLAAVGQGVAQMPYEQRKAAIAQLRPGLLARGLSEQAIDAFDPTDANIAAFTNQALGLKGMLEQQDRDADNRRADRQQTESERHNRSTEATARGQLGVAQGNLGLRRQEHGARVAAGGYGTPGGGAVAALPPGFVPD